MVSSTSSGAENVASMATNMVIDDALKIKMKKKKIIRKQKNMKIKPKNLMEYATIAVRRGI